MDPDRKTPSMETDHPADISHGMVGPVVEISNPTKALARRVIRKIDSRILLMMFVTYNLNFIDKTILSSASVFNLLDDNHLVGTNYSWVSSIFYFGYLVYEYPTTFLIQRLPVGKYLGSVTILWGVFVGVTAACSSFGGLATCRFLLGMAEATVSPAHVFITAMWYTRDEIPGRTGIWFAGNSVGGFIASLAAYGLGQITHPLHPWQWMFITFGVTTTLWGFVLVFLMPDTINGATFLTEEEKKYAEERVVIAGLGRFDPINSEWKLSQVLECFMDPKTFFMVAISICTQIPNGGTGSFGNLAIKSFGFTSLQSTLISLPASAISMTVIMITGLLAGRYSNISTYLLIAIVIPPVIGSALIYSVTNSGVRLFSYYLLAFGPGAIPLTLGLMSANTKGVTKKMTITAILFITYCAGNIAGPQFFLTSEASQGYPTAFKAILVCYSLVVVAAITLRIYLIWENKRRDRREGTGAAIPVDGSRKEVTAEDFQDTTDMETFGFRYRM